MRVFNLAEELEKERKKNKELEEIIDKIKEYVSGENANYLIENAESHLVAKAIDEILGDILEILEGSDNNG